MHLTAIVLQEEKLFTSLCPELEVASQGETRTEAMENLKEAIELLLEVASPENIQRRAFMNGLL